MYHGFIYLTTNLVNGKQYIGQTTKKESITYFGSGKVIKNAITKHGIENLSRTILAYAFNKTDLDFLEQHFISEYEALDNRAFYNIAEGGKTTRGFTGKAHTAEHKQHMSKLMLAAHPNKGKSFSNTVKQNMSKAKTGYSYGTWTVQTPNGIITIPSLADWCRDNGYGYDAIKSTLKRQRPQPSTGIQVLSYVKNTGSKH